MKNITIGFETYRKLAKNGGVSALSILNVVGKLTIDVPNVPHGIVKLAFVDEDDALMFVLKYL